MRRFGGEAGGPIFLDQVHCSGTESRLSDCDTTEVHMCDHDDDVGIICHRKNYTFTIVLSIYKKPIASQKRGKTISDGFNVNVVVYETKNGNFTATKNRNFTVLLFDLVKFLNLALNNLVVDCDTVFLSFYI